MRQLSPLACAALLELPAGWALPSGSQGPAALGLAVGLMLPGWLDLALLLAMGHFVGDFGLQGDRMAREKCPGQGTTLPWGWWLAAHAGIHAFLVAWLTGIPLLGLAEWLLHGLIDLGKCRRRYGIGVDQLLHLLCKLIWALLAQALLGASPLSP